MKILVISTGGTIASSQGDDGLVPTMPGEALLKEVPQLGTIADFEVLNLLSVDSSNINHGDWVKIIESIVANEKNFDAFVVSHGTDTMAYTAAALSFVLRGFPHPVVITGAMLPMGDPLTDARDNLLHSFIFAKAMKEENRSGVSICFAGVLIHGPRAKKISAKRMNAFESVYYPTIGAIESDKAVLTHRPSINTTELIDREHIAFDASILPVKVFPGFPARYMEQCVAMQPKAIVAECFGLGGLPYLGENLLPAVTKALEMGIIVVITTQCPRGGVDLSTYDVGQKSLKLGVLSGEDMGFEAIITKLMWLMPRIPRERIPEMFAFNFCDEIGQ